MNKSVELIKSEIYEVKSNLQKFTDLSKKEPENEAHSFYLTYFTNRLTILQQIKAELEAWEVVKDKFFIDIIERENDCKLGLEPKTPIINGIATRFTQLDNDKGIIIKKALEVSDEKIIE